MRMRAVLRYSLTLLVCGVILLGCACCTSQPIDTMTVGEWMDTVISNMQIEPSTTEKPYFINVDQTNPYFVSTQTAVEWGILPTSSPYDPQMELTREWTAYTLVNLAGLEPVNADFNDADEAQFGDYIQAAVNFGLFTLDKRRCFNPTATIDRTQALALLDKTIAYYDHQDLSEQSDLEFVDDIPIQTVTPIAVEEGDTRTTLTIPATQEVAVDDIVTYTDETGLTQSGQVESVESGGDEAVGDQYQSDTIMEEYQTVTIGPIDYFEVVEEGSIVYDEEVSLEDAIIEFESFNTDEFSLLPLDHDTEYVVEPLALTHQKTFDGFTCSYSISGSSITVNLTKKINDNLSIRGSFKLYNIKPVIIWDTHGLTIEHAKFELRASSLQSLSVRVGKYERLFADLNGITKDNILQKLFTNYQTKKVLGETMIPIATISLPIPEIPTATIKMQVQLRLSADGRLELKLDHDHDVGFEYKNGLFRIISDHDHDVDAVLKGNAYALAAIKAGLTLLSMDLMDVGLDGGVKATASVTAHMYDDNNNHTATTITASGDMADEISSEVDDVLTCTDLSAHWVLNVVVNSRDTVLSRFGLNHKWEIFNASNAPLFPGLTVHLENGQMVESCTRGSRTIHKTEPNKIKDYEKITLNKYSYVLDKGTTHQLELIGIPNDITKADLVYTTNNPAVATVDGDGLITGINEGAAVITISSKDDKYQTAINIIVRLSL